MNKPIHQASDKLFKQSMADSRVAREFFSTQLPAHLLKKIDLNSLKLQKNSFISAEFKTTEADMVYTATIDNDTAYFYLLCENQTSIEMNMAFRLLVYSVRIMEMHLKQNPHSPLPIVYPMVVYNGKKIWDAPKDIYPLFGEQQALARNILFQPYQLIDIARMSDDELQRHLWSGIMEFALKHRRTQDLNRLLDIFFPWLCEIEIQGGEDYAKIMLRYVIAGVQADDEKLLIEKSHQYLTTQLRDEVMTFAQRFEQIGFTKGKQEGMQQGEYNLLLRLLQRKFHHIPDQYGKKMAHATTEQLLKWADRIIDAATLQDIFAE